MQKAIGRRSRKWENKVSLKHTGKLSCGLMWLRIRTSRALLWEGWWTFGFHDSWQFFMIPPVDWSTDCSQLTVWRRVRAVVTVVTVSSRAYVTWSNHKFRYITRRCLLTAGRLHHVIPLYYSLVKLGSAEFNQYHAARLSSHCYPRLPAPQTFVVLFGLNRPSGVTFTTHTAIVTVRQTLLPLN
jgi:hypothetical protein